MEEDGARTVLPGFVKERRCCAWLAFPVVQAPDDLCESRLACPGCDLLYGAMIISCQNAQRGYAVRYF